MQMIRSKENAKLKAVRALVRSKKERQENSSFVIEGVRALRALLDGSALSQYTLREVWCSEKAPSLGSVDVPLYCIPHELMEQLSDCQTSQGVLGVVDYRSVPLDILPEKGSYLLLDQLMDPGNLGTLIRSAVAFGFNGILLYGDCVEVFNPKSIRSTMGALPFVNHWRVDESVFDHLKQMDYDLFSTVLRGGETLGEISFGDRNVLIIGNEARGISEDVHARSTRHLSIPMSGQVESLNAGVAGSICMSAMGPR